MSKQNDKFSKILWGIYIFAMFFVSTYIYENEGFYPAVFQIMQFIWLNTVLILMRLDSKESR